MNTLKVGTFAICGNMRKGYWLVDHATFNRWSDQKREDGANFKTRDEAAEYAQRCHDFKIGRRMSV